MPLIMITNDDGINAGGLAGSRIGFGFCMAKEFELLELLGAEARAEHGARGL